jgi:hypothetical protein
MNAQSNAPDRRIRVLWMTPPWCGGKFMLMDATGVRFGSGSGTCKGVELRSM